MLHRRALALIVVLTVATVPACAVPEKAPLIAANAKRQPVEGAAAQPKPIPLAPAATPQLLGVRPTKPPAGQPLPSLPREAYYGQPCAPPLPYAAGGPWSPPGIKGPWPADEYLHDGGDADEPVSVSPEWRVEGLNVEDAVAHYDTPDGRTLVEQTNCTYVYAPRFSSVRSVVALVSNEYVDGPSNFQKPLHAVRYEERSKVRTNVEQQQPLGATANLRPGLYLREQHDDAFSTNLLPSNVEQALLPFEDFSIIRSGAMQGNEKARLAEAVDAAIAWTKDDGVRVFINREKAAMNTGDQKAQVLFTVKEPENGRLRICKIASTPAAQPGEFVEFTLRFDNVGDQVLGNIVILDSLTTRLEYVPNSASSSRKAHFTTKTNLAESLELRWEIDEAIEPGEGGVVRFRCKVR